MPIRTLVTSSTVEAAPSVAEALPPDKKELIYNILESYLQLNEDPSDDQVHALAFSIGMDHEVFEQLMYEILSQMVQDGNPIKASDPHGKLAENDGEPDLESVDNKDPLKKAAESDGGIDLEQVDELLGKE